MTDTETKEAKTKQAKRIGRFITRRDSIEAANRLKIGPDGRRYVIRFSLAQRVEHLILLFSFTMLGATGLSQTFYDTMIGDYILNLFGGIDSIRQVHHFFAFLFGAQSIYHVWIFLYNLVIYRQISNIWPDRNDLEHFFQMLKLNLGISKQHPHFDRYTFEEKAEYWALVWGTVIMGVSGLTQWFPVFVTEFLPGWAIPAARALHKWEAILAVLAILTWHFYHVLIKTINTSIFTGIMTIEEMKEEHPAELYYLERAAKVAGSTKWPVFIDLHIDENKNSEVKSAVAKNMKKPKIVEKLKEARAKVEADGGEQ